ncbi:MAG: hypothetical protein ACNA70_06435 [Brevefilum sp.]
MKHKKWIFLGLMLTAVLILSGCGLFESDQPEDLQSMLETQVAQTQAAQNTLESIVAETMAALPTSEVLVPEATGTTGETPISEPEETATPTLMPTETPTTFPTATPTQASLVPLAEVSVPTNCRTGPGIIYDQVSVLNVGKQVEVVARHASGTYWVVANPGGSGTCWLWDRYAIITGSTANLPVWEAPPAPTPVAGVTPTPGALTLRVSVPTNCRVGPGKPYDIVTILRVGKSANVVGRHATADFWVIENPEGSGTCWVWGKYATLTGSTANLPIWDVPPTPTPAGAVTLKVSVDTNCRTGPGKPYDIITIFRTGKTAEVIGRNATSTYWVILNPEKSPGYCWVWGEYATLSGPSASLPVWDTPPTPTPKP